VCVFHVHCVCVYVSCTLHVCMFYVHCMRVFVYRWVHLVCALYVPGVAFSNVDSLNGVTLFEMPYTKWGAKVRHYSSVDHGLYSNASCCKSQ